MSCMTDYTNEELEEMNERDTYERRMNHLIRTLKELGYIEIKQNEYHRINSNPKNYGQTARVGFKFFNKPVKLSPMHIAKQCLNFKGCRCDNEDCTNLSCPLNLKLEKLNRA